MQLKLTPIVTGLCLLGLANVPALAAQTSDATNEQQLIEKLSAQTAALQKEVASLQAQVKAMKTTDSVKHTSGRQHISPAPKLVNTKTNNVPVPAQSVFQNADLQKKPITGQRSEQPIPIHSLSTQPIYIGGNPVVTSPFLGERSAFDASDLIVSLPNVGMDLRLLQERNKIYNIYKQYGLPDPAAPLVDLSGGVEAQYMNQKPFTGNKQSNIDLTRGELDAAANVNNWTTGFLALSYDNTPPATGQLVSNSRLFVDRGFITIGNLSKTPFYGTIGQMYVPFGRYSSYMISDSLPKMLARIKDRALLLGYDNNWGINEFNLSAFTFKGDSKTNANESKLNQLGANLDYNITADKWNAAIGGSLISNIADSLGMQSPVNVDAASSTPVTFGGFGNTSEVLVRRVPAYDLHGSIGAGSYSLLAEYVEAFHGFSPLNMTYNGHGADPSALNIEASYSFPIYTKPSSIAVGYGMSKDALALLLPQQRYIAAFNISLWKDTIEAIEYRHDINYPDSATASGQGIAVANNGFGHTSDTVTMQIGVYF